MASQQRDGWTPRVAALAVLSLLLGAWAFFVPLLGPYFGFGFETDSAWAFPEPHWTLSLAPGAAAAAGSLLLLLSPLGLGRLGLTLSLLAGLWLLAGPSLHPLWASGELQPLAVSETKQALLWIGYFYGTGGLLCLFTGWLLGMRMLTRPAIHAERTPYEIRPEARERILSL